MALSNRDHHLALIDAIDQDEAATLDTSIGDCDKANVVLDALAQLRKSIDNGAEPWADYTDEDEDEDEDT